MRREANRIWQILDYVFETPSEELNASRDVKSKRIITSIRDRLAVYNEQRKVKSPTGMAEFLGRKTNGPRYPQRALWPEEQEPQVKLEENEDREITEREQIAREQALEQAAVTNFYLQAQQQQQQMQYAQQQQQQQQQGLNGGQQVYYGGQQLMNGGQQLLNGSQQAIGGSQQLANGVQQSMAGAQPMVYNGQQPMNVGQGQMNVNQRHIPPMLQPQGFDMTGFDTLPVLPSATPSVAASPMDSLSVSHGPDGTGNNETVMADIDWV